MVAHTTQFCLPYFESTDSPCLNTGTVCEPSSVWCDLVTAIETQLTAFDEIIGRTASALPIAQVSYEPGMTDAPVVVGTVPFDIVDADTDQMVDLDVFAGIIPRRNGVYHIDATALYGTVAANDLPTIYIQVGNETTPDIAGTVIGVGTLITRGDPAVLPFIRASTLWEFTDATPDPRFVTLRLPVSSNLRSATLTVSWHSEID